MKKFILKIAIIILLTLILVIGIFISVIKLTGPGFDDTYQSVISRKFNELVSTNEKKIIIIGGSSAGFGINEDIISEETGYAVVNLGLHAGFGMAFPTDLSKANINEGDVVVLAYEYAGLDKLPNNFGVDLVMSGIDDNIGMYKYINYRYYDDIIDYLVDYSIKKYTRRTNNIIDKGIYSSSAFDDEGHMIYDRPTNLIQDDYDIDYYGEIKYDEFILTQDAESYLLDYIDYVESCGGIVLFATPPSMKSANHLSDEFYDQMVNTIENKLGIDYICNPKDYVYDSSYMYNTIYHLNDKGADLHSKKLASDINAALLKLK